MHNILQALLAETGKTIRGDGLPALAREHRLATCGRQLEHLAVLEDTLGHIGAALHRLASRGAPQLAEVKPLQEEARAATSLIRGHIYLAEQREKTEAVLWEEINLKLAHPLPPEEAVTQDSKETGPSPAEAAPAGRTEEKKSGTMQAAPARPDPTPQGASLHRLKKNMKTRFTGEKGLEKNKSATLAAIEQDLTKARALLADHKRELMNSAAASGGPPEI